MVTARMSHYIGAPKVNNITTLSIVSEKLTNRDPCDGAADVEHEQVRGESDDDPAQEERDGDKLYSSSAP